MKKLKDIFHCILTKTKVKKLCFLSALIGYQTTGEWIKEKVPEAAFLIGEYLNKHSEEEGSVIEKCFKDPDYIFDKALNRYKQSELLKKHGFETDEIKMMEER